LLSFSFALCIKHIYNLVINNGIAVIPIITVFIYKIIWGFKKRW